MATNDTQRKNEDLTLSHKLIMFVQKNRRPLFIGLIAMLVILAGFIIVTTVTEKNQANAISKVDEFSRRYTDLRSFMSNEEEQTDLAKQGEIAVLLLELEDFAKRGSGFAAARAYCISAEIYTQQKKWAEAEAAWSNASKAAGKTYLAPITTFNAAVAAEEQGNIQAAIDYYNTALVYGDTFVSASRAQFSIGRLEEERNSKDAALAAYKTLISRWPQDTVWASLAQNRILVLSE